MTDELWSRSATWLTRAIAAREVSSLEAVDACLARIEAVNPRINAVVRRAGDARDRAREADAALGRGDATGPLHGVPFTIKDSMDTAGVVTTAGTVGWRNRIPDRDATVVGRLRAAGGILVGKTNTPEFTWANETDNDVYGRTSNPYDLGRSPGGSSGGSASIVAAGGSPFDIGSDSGNSIRQPAHLCGVAGIKPTSGRVPRTGHWPGPGGLFETFTQLGPIARRVEDLALVLPIIAGPDGEDPHVVPVSLGDPVRVDVGGLRVAWFGDNGIRTPTPETLEAVGRAVAAIAATGARVEAHLPPDIVDARPAWEAVIRADGFAWLWRLIEAAGTPGHGSFDTFGWVTVRPGEPLPGDALTAAVERAGAVRARLLRWFAPYDLLVSPVLPLPAIRHGESRTAIYGDTYSEIHNLTGWPAAVVRAGTSPEGLPIGVQLVAKPWREDVALAAALVVEAATGGWQAPPL
jgi:amidase